MNYSDSSSEPLQYGMADSTAIHPNNQAENHLKRKNKVFQHIASDEKQLSELELDVLTIEDIELKQSRYSEDESLNEDNTFQTK